MDEQGIETYCYDLDWRRLDIQYYHQVAEEVMEKKSEILMVCLV